MAEIGQCSWWSYFRVHRGDAMIFFPPDVRGWEEGRSQDQNFNCKYLYFYTEVIIVYCTVCKTHISFKWCIVFENVARNDFN
jgi:hypothetical protein